MSSQHDPGNPAAPNLTLARSHELTRLLEQTARGDQNAFAGFYDATVGAMYTLALVVCADSVEAEALTCRVYLRVWTSAPAFPTSGETATDWFAALVGRQTQSERLSRREAAILTP